MTFEVLLSEDAARDIEDIYRYIAEYDVIENADRVLLALEEICLALSELPDRGNVPKELRSLGMTEFREVHYKPYRVIYRIVDRLVVVYCVVDGRRDMQGLLQRRLLR
ncbi:type II toxin-antitoxin system RelE/ParE family toxin [Magnetospirillum sp. 15-1]|uniref:type II toxin-antitoxin system RelE/ParE family toxin n=1 Tax=Magnetospirillum sp. 15-1 TaxID=1979370 RepID=UPI000BBC02F3|nr:type II toxin-antitoxin system RelE/ParE family toxin [Magnetospirillum sp. 15-1]